MITQARLKELYHYNPETGKFTRIKFGRGRYKGLPVGRISDGYLRIKIDGRAYMAHRLAVLYMEGYMPENTVDHIKRVRDDNRYNELREASRQCQQRNCGMFKNNTSGIKGVYWDTKKGKWHSHIAVDGKAKFLGLTHDKLDAAYQRFAAEQCLGFQDCDINSSAKQYIDRKQFQHDNALPFWGPV